ncbi:hypothetical protein DERP_003900 [Dermatophagoides pteronyssinus]|uniref:F-box domain-containing protein n=1 Tax=Dermatophagoides pteronyssinus TaxID=6956 RepID=A0ABQ8J831_DERPT|nr:hypothetical protein DERP_003900 [Dermatophagoides pteronyssinus]
MFIILNQDCLRSVFEHLSMMERLKCRLVCQQWKSVIDQMAIVEKSLEIYAVHSYLANDARQQSGMIDDHHQQQIDNEQNNQSFNYRFNYKPWFIEQIINQWKQFNESLISVEPIDNIFNSSNDSDNIDSDDDDDDNNDYIQFNDNSKSSLSSIWPYSSSFTSSTKLSSSSSLPNLNDILSSHYYWNYAFCSTSSLFSTYVMNKSSLVSHKFSHTFCRCRCQNRFKYSMILDRQQQQSSYNYLIKMNQLLEKFPNIHHLHMNNVIELNDTILALIAKHCHQLRHLSFVNCQQSSQSTITNDFNLLLQQKNSIIENNFIENEPFLLFNNNCLIDDYGWKLLNRTYPLLQSLTLRQCHLNEQQLTTVIRYCSSINYLDISDNQRVGKSVRYLGENIECLICGNLAEDESIEQILANIAFGNGKNVHYLSIFGPLNDSLKIFKEFDKLNKLELHFHSDNDDQTTWLSDIGLLSLNSLVLEQIRSYESPSTINHQQFEQMLRRSKNLQRLQIIGDFDWNLRLNDFSLQSLSEQCPILKELTLIGNASITDYGLLNLRHIPLTQLSLSSFNMLTDYSITTLIEQIPTLTTIILVDMPHITNRVIDKTIDICNEQPDRFIDLTFSDERMHRRIEKQQSCPNVDDNNMGPYPLNLNVHFDSHICGKHVIDSEPSDLQMLLVILISALILSMTLLTTIVVILVPLSMLLIMANEYIGQNWLSFLNLDILYRFLLEYQHHISD